MSNFYNNPLETSISIPKVNLVDGIAYYKIHVTCFNKCEWTVLRRYRDFLSLHEKLLNYSVTKDLLPKKKVIGNTNAKFMEQRREDLEKYLQKIAHMLQRHMPVELVEFLDFHKYDVIFLLQDLAAKIHKNGEKYLQENGKKWTFTILELHAITTRLRLPCPHQEIQEKKFDFAQIVDFCTQLEALKIIPTHEIDANDSKDKFLHQLVNPLNDSSNILPSNLAFELSPFSSVTNLQFFGICPMNVEFNNARIHENCESFTVKFTRAENIQNILNPEAIHTDSLTDKKWSNIKEVNFSSNDIWQLDAALKLIPNVETLVLDSNRLRSVSNLRHLSKLSYLSLNNNLIEDLSKWCLELGNIQTLNLAGNKLVKLNGLCKLRSIKSLDLSCNYISRIEEVDEVAALPCLEIIGLNGNPLAFEIDYRARVIARFDDRAREVTLDSEKCSQFEIDKAMVLSALRKSKLT